MDVSRIDWNDEFKLGLPTIDAEHKELLAVCNQFLDAVQAQAPLRQLADILHAMIARARNHFRAEEHMLDRHGYPALAAHKAEHDRLLVQAEALKSRYDDAGQEEEMSRLTTETATFLQTWLLDHIRANDRPYRPFLMTLG